MNVGQPGPTKVAVVYVSLVLLLGAGLLLREWARFDASPDTWGTTFLYWLFLSLAAECFWLRTPTGTGMISMSLAVNLATLLALPPALALTAGAVSVGLSDLLMHRRSLLKAAFNAAQTCIALAAGVWILHRSAGGPGPQVWAELLQRPLAVLAVPVVFFLVNTSLVAGVISLFQRRAFWTTWRENYGFSYQVLSSGVQFLLGVGLVLAGQAIGYVSGLLALILFFFVRDAYQRYVRDLKEESGSEAFQNRSPSRVSSLSR